MAKGDNGSSVKWYLAFALIIVVALVATDLWNPFPDLWEWTNRSKPLSQPDVVWQQRLGSGTPQSVTIAGEAVVVRHRTAVEARNLSSGVRLWRRKADWAVVAGGPQDAVVAMGKLLVKGYEVIDPQTGAVRRRDDSAVAVWTFQNALLDARCFEPNACTLTAWDPRGSTPRWTVDLPGITATLFADNPELLGTRRLTTGRVAPDAGGPEQMPSLIGFPVDGRVYVVNTATGRLVREVKPGRQERIVVVGGRVLHIRSIAEDGTCYFTVQGRDPANNQTAWRRTGLNLRTADRAGCAQRQNPQGSRNVIVGAAPDRREAVLDAHDGRQLWTGGPGDELAAVNDRYALVRTADGKSIKSYELSVAAPRWARQIRPESQVALARHVGLVLEEKPDRIVAVDQRTGRELVKLRTSAKVLAVGADGMIIGDGRDIGYVRFDGSAGAPGDRGPGESGPSTGPGAGEEPGKGPNAGPTCAGPKREQCASPVDGKDG